MIYPMDGAIHRLNNWGLHRNDSLKLVPLLTPSNALLTEVLLTEIAEMSLQAAFKAFGQ